MNTPAERLLKVVVQETEKYRRTQVGYFIIAACGIPAFILAIVSSVTNVPILAWVWVVSLGTMGLLLFGTLNVMVGNASLKIRFGIGVICKRFLLSEIKSYRIVKNPWYYGWGIHFTPRGWVFNVSGFSAVELEMASGKNHRIGTDDPEGLEKALYRAL